jgi:hypothetical protein
VWNLEAWDTEECFKYAPLIEVLFQTYFTLNNILAFKGQILMSRRLGRSELFDL